MESAGDEGDHGEDGAFGPQHRQPPGHGGEGGADRGGGVLPAHRQRAEDGHAELDQEQAAEAGGGGIERGGPAAGDGAVVVVMGCSFLRGVAPWESARTERDVDHRGSYFTLRGGCGSRRPCRAIRCCYRRAVPPRGGGSREPGPRGAFAAALTKAGAIEHYDEVKRHALAAGRDPDDVKILPGVLLSLGNTEEEARRRSDELHDLGPASYSVQWLSGSLGIDASQLALDEPFPEEVLRTALDPSFAGDSIGFRQSIVRQIRTPAGKIKIFIPNGRLCLPPAPAPAAAGSRRSVVRALRSARPPRAGGGA